MDMKGNIPNWIKENTPIEPFNVEATYWGCFRDELPEPFSLWMFKSDAEKWVSQQLVKYEIKPIRVSY